MKRYEKMSKEELFKLIGYDVNCEVCPVHAKGMNCKPDGIIHCMDTIHNYLNEELTPRIARINTT